MPSPALSDDAALRIELTVTLMSGILNGSLASKQSFSQDRGANRLQESQRVADHHRDECFAVAGSLMAYDKATYGDNASPTRVRGVTTLFSAAVSGLVASGTSPADAMNQVNRTRDRLFLSTNRVLQQQQDLTNAPAAETPQRLGVGAWRQGRETRELELTSGPEVSTPRRPGLR